MTANTGVFTITYWGVTGTLTAPLRPAEVTDKLISALQYLMERDRLADLRPGPDLPANLRRRLGRSCRSTSAAATAATPLRRSADARCLDYFDCGSGFRELGVSLDALAVQTPAPKRTPCPGHTSAHRSYLRDAVFPPILSIRPTASPFTGRRKLSTTSAAI